MTDFGDQITIGRFAAAGSEVYGANVTRALGTDEAASQLGDRITSFSNQRITINAMGGDDFIQQAGAGAATIYGGNGADIIFGGANDDTIFGGNGNDLINGGEGNDLLHGDAGNDTLNGGFGNDPVIGGSGADEFFFNSLFGDGTTVVEDFEQGADMLRFVGLRSTDRDIERLNITNTTFDGQQSVTMSYADHTVIVLGETANSFDDSDFLFG